jgi:hypothetical protein
VKLINVDRKAAERVISATRILEDEGAVVLEQEDGEAEVEGEEPSAE